jgi:hypothetical protein
MRRDNPERRVTVMNIFKEYFKDIIKSVEIGCAAGDFSNQIITVLPIEQHYMVDPWLTEEDNNRSQWFSNANPAEISYQFVLDRFKDKPVTIARQFSSEFLVKANEEDLEFDFMYVDGDHHKLPVYKDLIQSYEILKVGGILAGDDYNWVSKQTKLEEVKLGVELFEEETGLKFNIIKGDRGGLDQYYLIK